MMGLLIAGKLVSVPGLTVIPPASHGGPAWARLDPGDCTARETKWIRQIILHTTKGEWPQHVIAGPGLAGRSQAVADFWRHDPIHSAAQLVVDIDGTVACLCDLARTVAYHAEACNPWSIGIEMYQISGGGLYEATLIATTVLVEFLCERFGFPQLMPRGPYRNQPLHRMEIGSGSTRHQLGGPDAVGVFGHRDNTERRGRGDPGDEIFTRLATIGWEGVDYDGSEDLHLGALRQQALNVRGEKLDVDGVCGPASWAAMKRQGFARWRDVA
jgi:hypothetical protein